jgi:cytochrome c oxidase cbb3-type subunit IV
MMDLNDLRSLSTVALLGVFVGIVVWAWSRRNQSRFDEASRLLLEEPDSNAVTTTP